MEEEKKEKTFVIKDRRHFDESGAVRQDEEAKPQAKPPEEEVKNTQAPPEAGAASGAEEAPLPEVNFASFIFSLSTTAMYHFGDFPDPDTQESRKNLPAAKQTIDILSILKAKTEGNLDESERELLDGILYELRMRFVKEMSNR
jgi:hypothetical protein